MTKVENQSQKILNIFDKNDFSEILSTAKLSYESDISWGYRAETSDYCIDFYQDESGKNHISEFAIYKKETWISITPTNEQTRLMFQKLNETPYREVEVESLPAISNYYDYYGVQPSNFY